MSQASRSNPLSAAMVNMIRTCRNRGAVACSCSPVAVDMQGDTLEICGELQGPVGTSGQLSRESWSLCYSDNKRGHKPMNMALWVVVWAQALGNQTQGTFPKQ